MENRNDWYYVSGWLLSIGTVLGNGLVVFLIATRKKLHTTANYFIASLCVADFFVGLSLFPPLFACDAWLLCNKNITTPVRWFFLHVSITNICAMAAERYFAIVLPLKYLANVTWKKALLCIILAWVIPVIAYMIPFTVLFVDNRQSELRYFFIFSVVVLIFLPMVLLGSMTARIMLITRRLSGEIDAQLLSVRFNHCAGPNPSPQGSRLHRYSARVIVVVVALFFLCYGIDIYFIFCDSFRICTFPPQLRYVKHILLITNSAVNPLAYAFFKKDVRYAMKTMFLRRRNPYCCSVDSGLAVPRTRTPFTLPSTRRWHVTPKGYRLHTIGRTSYHFKSSVGPL